MCILQNKTEGQLPDLRKNSILVAEKLRDKQAGRKGV